MAEYKFKNAVVRIHGEVDRERIEKACQAYLRIPPSKNKKEKEK